MKLAYLLAAAVLVAGGMSAAGAAGTDIMRKPSKWRGTLLEGTDALVASNKYGEPLFIKVDDTVAPMFTPSALAGDRLAAEFKRLCLDTGYDQARLASAAAGSSWKLSQRSLSVPAPRGDALYAASLWHSPEARVQIWTGDLSPLKNRQSLSRWRNGMTASNFRLSDVPAPSCAVTVMATDFHDPQPFIAALTGLLGVQPAKVVTKQPWADGHWSIANPDGTETRVSYSMTDLDRAEQLLHVAVSRQVKK